jgi:hypothetical protein
MNTKIIQLYNSNFQIASLSNGKQYLYKGPRDIQKLKQFVNDKEYVDLDALDFPSPNLPYDNEFFEALLIILVIIFLQQHSR